MRTALSVALAALVSLSGLVLVLSALQGCAPDPYPTTRIWGELDAATLHRIAEALPVLPASPWPCVADLHLDESCPGTHGCYYPDERAIYSSPAALPHELGHAASECATGDPDYDHRAEWWGWLP